MRRLSLSLALLVAAASPSFADAKADKAKAKTLYEEGLKHYNVAEWQDAVKSWKESYLLSKKPLLLFNIGQAYRLSGDCKQAMMFYDSYQREEPNPKNQTELDAAVALCKQQLDKPTDPKPVDTKPVETKRVETKPVESKRVETNPVETKPVETKPVETKPVETKPVVAQKSEPEHAEPIDSGPHTTGGGMRKVGLVVGGVGIAATGAGVFSALGAKKASNDLDRYTGDWGPTQKTTEARGQRDQKFAYVFGGIGLVAIIAGGVMYAIGGPKTESATLSVVPTEGGAMAGWVGSF